MSEQPEWYACEDCLGTGGQRDERGEGQCGACGGSGRLPANEAADIIVAERARERTEAIWAQAERDVNE